MGRVVAIGGFATENAIRLDTYAVKLTNKETPNVLLVPTAASDAQANVENGIAKFESLGCRVKALCLVTKSYTDEEMETLLSWADMIYVGGGDTISMMRVWREHGLDVRLKEIYRRDAAVLAGISAGAICWFACGHSDSESFHKKDGWSFCWAEGMLDLFHKVYCPHYNDAGRETFDAMLKEKDMVGLAVDNDAAFVENGAEQYCIRCNPNAQVYELQYVGGTLQKCAIEMLDI
ncbi:MAG: Type 1 glutamine amidotransferase-like domain-containing protein [Clostridia bacterium]|nr:Type 1 glutamine amidotransferase-like domain-containing protein [Clostridia bacterium]